MAKLKGPLFSLEAVGTFGDILTFSKRKSGQQVRYQQKQSDANTEAQNTIRDYFKLGVELWNSLPTEEKSYWTEIDRKGYADV